MKILHTADIHLRRYDDERWAALKTLIKIGKDKKIDIFVISGDLFDKDINAEKLRVKIRNIFSGTGFKIIIIPGNHDSASFTPGLFFGNDVVILGENTYDIGSVRFIGFPFSNIENGMVFKKLNNLSFVLKKEGTNILLFHGELLDVFFSRDDFGAEGNKRYMPVKKSYFDNLNIDYVLAGHFHTHFDVYQLKNGGYFVYPGSPISITKKEIGRRAVNIFEVGNAPNEFYLDTPYYEKLDIELDPFENENPVQIIQKSLEAVPENARILLNVKGYFDGKAVGITEEGLSKRITALVGSRCASKPVLEFKDIRLLLEDDLFNVFLKKLKKKEIDEEQKKKMRNIAIKAIKETML